MRPPIPEPIKRQVRQECGHGCVVCGRIGYHYDHIIEYSEVQEHRPENIALLCYEHHGEKTAGRLSTSMVTEARRLPFCTSRPGRSPWFVARPETLSPCIVGSSVFDTAVLATGVDMHIVWLGGPVITARIENQILKFDVRVTNEGGTQDFEIRNNEVVADPNVYDVQLVGTTLTLWRGPRDIALRLDTSPSGLQLERLRYRSPVGSVEISAEVLAVDGRGPSINMSRSLVNGVIQGGIVTRDYPGLAAIRF